MLDQRENIGNSYSRPLHCRVLLALIGTQRQDRRVDPWKKCESEGP